MNTRTERLVGDLVLYRPTVPARAAPSGDTPEGWSEGKPCHHNESGFRMRGKLSTIGLLTLLLASGAAQAQDKTLRLLTWPDYVPKAVMEQFTQETGIKVEITIANNEEMISKLRATAGFDLAQPSQDRIAGPQAEFGIYKPLDLSRIKSAQFIPSMLEATQINATVAGKVYAVPHLWGTDGLAVNTQLSKVADYTDLCKPENAGKVGMRLNRPTLIAFAFALGKNPFAAYNDPKAYRALMDEVGKKLMACKANVRFYRDGNDQLLSALRSSELTAAMLSDAGAWGLRKEVPDLQYLAPKAGALGRIDTYAIPAKGKNDEAAYAWINFNMRPEIAAKVSSAVGNFTASKGAEQGVDPELKQQFAASFPEAALKNIQWYPAVPAGLEEIEGRVLDRVKAAR